MANYQMRVLLYAGRPNWARDSGGDMDRPAMFCARSSTSPVWASGRASTRNARTHGRWREPPGRSVSCHNTCSGSWREAPERSR